MTKIVVGLGNPGKQYVTTRHNIGRKVIEALAPSPYFQSREGAGVFLFIPDGYMNECGPSIAEFARRKGAAPEELLIISDDFELPLGLLRLRRGGSSGGHNGLKSIFQSFGTQEIPRVRVGIGPVPVGQDPKNFVLESFRTAEREGVQEAVDRAARAVLKIIESGMESAMNEFNVKKP